MTNGWPRSGMARRLVKAWTGISATVLNCGDHLLPGVA